MSTICSSCGGDNSSISVESSDCVAGSFLSSTQSASGDCVISVNGKVGVVTLTTSHIEEGTNLYFTEERARGSISGTDPIEYAEETGVISHKASPASAGSYGDDSKYIAVVIDEHGHITGIEEKSLPASTVGADGQAIEALTGTGYLVRTGTNTWALKSILGTSGRTVVTYGDPLTNQTIVDLANISTPVGTFGGTTKVAKVTTDAYGRVTGIEEVNIAFPSSDASGTNGLGGTAGVVELGGNLTKNTTIDLKTFNLFLAKYDSVETDKLTVYFIVGNQSGNDVLYYGVKEGVSDADFLTTAITNGILHTVKSTTNEKLADASYICEAFLLINGKDGDGNANAIIGTHFPTSEGEEIPAPAIDPDATSFVKSTEGKLELYAKEVDFSNGNPRISNPIVPASATASGKKGEIAYDNTYLYICIADNTWKRTLIETW